MKSISKILFPSAIALLALPVALAGCPFASECETDDDCVAPETCNTIIGICEGAEGEGEGEGEGECAALDDFTDTTGDGVITISDAEYESDGTVDCAAAGGDGYMIWFIMSGDYNVDWSGNEVQFANPDNADSPSYCSSFPSGVLVDDPATDCGAANGDCYVGCPACMAGDSGGVAVQVEDDDGSLSDAVCATAI